jgi:uncharacterized membrane protein
MSQLWADRQRRILDAIAPVELPRPRVVPLEAPWNWLAAGWRDMWRQPALSLGYGAMFALGALCLALVFASLQAHALFLTLAGGFLLVGPLVAVGLYEYSRRLAAGQSVTLTDMLRAGRSAPGQLSFFGILLLLLALIWVRLAFLLLMLFLGTLAVPPPEEFMRLLLFTPQGLGLLIVGTIVGGALAALVFAMSAVAVPLLLDRRTDAVTAARASVAAVAANPLSMALWAALIVVIMAAGFATLLVGLVLAFPLVGHASWHAYRDIYGAP